MRDFVIGTMIILIIPSIVAIVLGLSISYVGCKGRWGENAVWGITSKCLIKTNKGLIPEKVIRMNENDLIIGD